MLCTNSSGRIDASKTSTKFVTHLVGSCVFMHFIKKRNLRQRKQSNAVLFMTMFNTFPDCVSVNTKHRFADWQLPVSLQKILPTWFWCENTWLSHLNYGNLRCGNESTHQWWWRHAVPAHFIYKSLKNWKKSIYIAEHMFRIIRINFNLTSGMKFAKLSSGMCAGRDPIVGRLAFGHLL